MGKKSRYSSLQTVDGFLCFYTVEHEFSAVMLFSTRKTKSAEDNCLEKKIVWYLQKLQIQ